MPDASAPPPLLIACCGNSSAGDDALGALVVRALRAEGLPPGVEVLDLGANPAALTSHIEGRAALIVVDAMALESGAAGELIDCGWPQARAAILGAAPRVASTHGISLADQLELAEKLGILPHIVRLVGLTIEQTSVGHALSAAVRRQLPAFVRHVRSVVSELAPAR